MDTDELRGLALAARHKYGIAAALNEVGQQTANPGGNIVLHETGGRTVKCPICGEPYKVYPYFAGDQSACPPCRRKAEGRR